MNQLAKRAPETVVASTTAAAAQALASAAYLPLHLKGKVSKGGRIQPGDEYSPEVIIATCSALVSQAEAWDVDPMALANESYSVHGRLGYQGKVLAAIVQRHDKGLESGLSMIYHGSGDGLVGVCYGVTGDLKPSDISDDLLNFLATGDVSAQNRLTLAGCKTYRVTRKEAQSDNALWQSDPQQKLYYTCAVRWCRRYTPEILLGAITDDEVDYLAARDEVGPVRPQTIAGVIEAHTGPSIDGGDGDHQSTNDVGRDINFDYTPGASERMARSQGLEPETLDDGTPLVTSPGPKRPRPPLDATDPVKFREICVERFGKCNTPLELKRKYTAARKAVKDGKILPPPSWENIMDTAQQDRLYVVSDPNFVAKGGEV